MSGHLNTHTNTHTHTHTHTEALILEDVIVHAWQCKNLRKCKQNTQSHNHIHLHTTNPCRACEDIQFWEDSYETFEVREMESHTEGLLKERKKERKTSIYIILLKK